MTPPTLLDAAPVALFTPSASVPVAPAGQAAVSASSAWMVLSAVSSGLSAYHGYRRNDSVAWGVVWGLLGAVAPVITPAIALGQGFGERRGTRERGLFDEYERAPKNYRSRFRSRHAAR